MGIVAACLACLGATGVLVDDGGDHYRISAVTGPYFVCDDRVLEDRWLLERFVVPIERHPGNPLIVRDSPWEGTGPHMGGSVLYDPEAKVYRMWYSVWNSHAYYNKLPFSYNVCYAESDDGLAWRKPALGVFEYEGNTNNNCIKLGTDKTQNIDVCLNPQPDRYPGRFLAIHNQKGGVFVSSSEDGKSFERLWPDAPAISYHSDTHNNFVFDDVRGEWYLYCRPRAYAGYHKRRVSMQRTSDLAHWPHERTILVPTETEIPEFYGMTVFRRGDLFWGVLQIYEKDAGTIHGELRWSGDGVHWDAVATHPPFSTLGAPGAWDASMVLVAESPVIVGDQMRFYYGGMPLSHNTKEENVGAIGLFTAELDRMAGLRTNSAEPGFALTRPFAPKGRLVINARVNGEIRAELRTDDNKTLEGWSLDDCDPVTESGFGEEMKWRGRSLSEFSAQSPDAEVRVLFRLTDAEIFTFDLAS